jgi:hypothetical protein
MLEHQRQNKASQVVRADKVLHARRQQQRLIDLPGAERGFPASEADIRAFVERVVDRAPYDPSGIARQSAAGGYEFDGRFVQLGAFPGPPSAAVRQVSIADMTFGWARLTWPALASRHAAP